MRTSLRSTSFSLSFEIRHIHFCAFVALNPLVTPLMNRLVACSSRVKQTERQTDSAVTLAAHVPRINYMCGLACGTYNVHGWLALGGACIITATLYYVEL